MTDAAWHVTLHPPVLLATTKAVHHDHVARFHVAPGRHYEPHQGWHFDTGEYGPRSRHPRP